MMRQETPLYLLPYQQAVLDADRLISSPPPTSNVVRGGGHVVVDEFNSISIEEQIETAEKNHHENLKAGR